MPKFRAINAPPYFSRTDVLGGIAKFATVVQNSNEVNKPSFHASSGDSKIIQNERINWTRFSSDSKNAGNLERSKSGVISNENLDPITQTKYSYGAGNDFLATHASGFERTNDDISVAVENRRKSSSVRFDSFVNKDVEGEMSRWKQGVNRFSLQIARTNVPRDSQANASTHSIHKDRNSIRKTTNSSVISHGNSKPSVVINSSRSIGDHGDLNNSERSAHDAKTVLIPNSKFEIVGQSPAFRRRNATTSHRNFVKLRYPYSTLNWRNVSNVALNMKMKNGNNIFTDIQLRKPVKHFTRIGAKKPVSLNNHVTSKPMKSNHSSSVQESPSQKVGSENRTVDKYNDTTLHDAYLKNWPNDAIQDFEDLYNYEKYTSSLEEESSHESSLSSAEEIPILSSNNYFDHSDPILDSSVKKIIHWLKVPEIVPNNTQYFDHDDDKPIESNYESIYENLEPNSPLNTNTHDDNYDTVVLQDVPLSQNLDTIDSNYPIRWSNPSSITSLQYETDSSNPSAPLIPSFWPGGALLQNKTVYNPTTHVTQNTVVHILNDGLKKPNVTRLKASEANAAAANQATSSGSSSESLVQIPNVMFTSQKDENKNISKQETDTFPSSTYNTNCPTIMINTYTRVNNTLQSKEGCTDLNIIVNSHVLNTNVFKPSSAPATAEDHQTSLTTQNYGSADESEEYSDVLTDLSHVDSLGNYVTASTGTYSNLLETLQPDQHDYYDSQKDPSEILDPAQSLGLSTIDNLHTVEVSQGTQISVSLTNAEESLAGSSVDGPGNDASSSAVNPPAASASASGPPVAGTPVSENPSVPVAQELPVYLIKPGPVTGQSSAGLGSLQLSALPNLPSLNIATKPDLSSSAGSSLSPALGSSGSLPDDDDDDDDDFDFDFDMSPGDVLQYMAKAFTYFSFLNPLGYGVVSLTSAPFVAMAAGILGIAAFIFPWALPSAFEFGRSADKTIGFTPNLEEFVKQAVHKYDRLNEWKSRRRKRRR